MPYQTNWLIPNRLIYCRAWGDVDLDTLHELDQEFIALLNTGESPVHVLANAQAVKKTPSNVLEIRNRQTYMNHAHLGWVVLCGSSSFVQFLGNILIQATKLHLKMTKTEADALTFLKNMAELDWSQADMSLLASDSE